MPGGLLNNLVIAVILLIVGVGLGLRADKWWGWLLVAAAAWLAYHSVYG